MDYDNLKGKWNRDKRNERILFTLFFIVILSIGVII